MRLTTILTQARVGLMALALVLTGSLAHAADLTSGLTAGSWSTISTLHNDEYSIIKATKLNATTTSATLDIPGNTLAAPRIYLFGTNTGDNGISSTLAQSPLDLTGVEIDGSSTSYTDTVSSTSTLADVTTAAKITSATLDTSARQIKLTAANVSTSEVLDVRVEYRVPAKYRWYQRLR